MNKAVKVAALRGHLLTSLLCAIAVGVPFVTMAMATPAERIADLETKRTELQNSSQQILDGLKDGEDMTDEQTEALEANAAEIEKIDKQISALKKVQPTGTGRKTEENRSGTPAAGSAGRVVSPANRDPQRHGFRSFGAFAQAVRDEKRGVENDETRKLKNAATSFGSEGTGTDGGFLIPPAFSTTLWQKVQAEENLLNRCTPLQTDGNGLMIPKDETTPWQTTGGVQVYWEGEAAQIPQSKPSFEMGMLRLSKLTALVPISEEMQQDAAGIESYLQAKAPGKMVAKINTAIIAGTGAGQPLGIIPGYTAVGASVVQVAKETSQPADTVWFANINKMWGRIYAGWRRNAIWLINQDIEPQLEGMAFVGNGITPTAASSTPVYMPPGGIADAPYGRLKGRPVVPVEACAALGDLGDIILCDLTQYWGLTKAGGIQTDTSIHLWFDQALTAFRFIFRVNGQPAWSSTISRQNGSNALSWAVALQAR